MKMHNRIPFALGLICLATISVVITGCPKSEDAPAATTTPANAASPNATGAATSKGGLGQTPDLATPPPGARTDLSGGLNK